jgi:hypothetical protein
VPLLDIFWTMLMFASLALAFWLLFVVLRDVFQRPDMTAGAKLGWTLAACIFPLVGSLAYLVTRPPSTGELSMGWHASRERAGIYD